MKEMGYFIAKLKFKLCGNRKESISEYFRKHGMKIGDGCNICCNIMTTEPYFISLGNNVTISGEVMFVTHDNSASKIIPEKPNLYGRIKIGDNCFIGARSLIMYGVELANNIIVAAGSVVCNSFYNEGVIIGGNPAKVIGTWNDFENKISIHGMKSGKAREISNLESKEFIVRGSKLE